MATLVFTALGTALGGPLGGAIGSLLGNRIDRAVIGGASREGPRLKDLAVTTSSYGHPIPRHHGTMRAAGSVIWATELTETRERSGGGKGRPSVTTYSYAASFAVALSSRPIVRLGRIWADGNLLRGAAGDLKTGGELRVYQGYGDQQPDRLIAAAQGAACPAFRGTAYCVFEGLQLGEFGNRIPALTFEIVADNGEVSLVELVEGKSGMDVQAALPGLAGFSDEGGSAAGMLALIAEAYPLACSVAGDALTIRPAYAVPAEPMILPPPAIDRVDESFGGAAGRARQRRADAGELPTALRYYDIARDHQPGIQRAEGRAATGRERTIELPGAMAAQTARSLANAAAERASRSRETLAWRTAELDPSLGSGSVVRVPGETGLWRIESWEWRESGIELELARMPRGPARISPGDPGSGMPIPDLPIRPTLLRAFELPADGGSESGEGRRIYVAASSTSAGWRGAALYHERGGLITPLGTSATRRSTIGAIIAPVGSSQAVLFEPEGTLEVRLVAGDLTLPSTTVAGLANGANRALLGGEVLQFAAADHLEGGRWVLQGLLRGRAGTESAAMAGHDAGTSFVLLDDAVIALDAESVGMPAIGAVVAIGLADDEPPSAAVANGGLSIRPPAPVHGRAEQAPDGTLMLRWARRARGAWTWPDEVELPLNEQIERYWVELGGAENPAMRWETDHPALDIPSALLMELAASHPGYALSVRQVGSLAASDPLFLTTIA